MSGWCLEISEASHPPINQNKNRSSASNSMLSTREKEREKKTNHAVFLGSLRIRFRMRTLWISFDNFMRVSSWISIGKSLRNKVRWSLSLTNSKLEKEKKKKKIILTKKKKDFFSSDYAHSLAISWLYIKFLYLLTHLLIFVEWSSWSFYSSLFILFRQLFWDDFFFFSWRLFGFLLTFFRSGGFRCGSWRCFAFLCSCREEKYSINLSST